MSLEDEIKRLADSVDALNKTMSASGNASAASKSGKSTRAKNKKDEPAPKDAPAAAAELDYDADVKPLVLRVVAECGRDEATAILARLGVARALDLTAEQWPSAIELCNESLAGNSAQDGEKSEADLV